MTIWSECIRPNNLCAISEIISGSRLWSLRRLISEDVFAFSSIKILYSFLAKKEYKILIDEKAKTSSEINLLRDHNLDPDIISEIAHKLLGLIHSDQIVIDIPK